MRLTLLILLACSTLNAQTVLRSAVIRSWNCGGTTPPTNPPAGGGGCTNTLFMRGAFYGIANPGSQYQVTNYAIRFVATSNSTVCEAEIALQRVGSPTNSLRVGVFSSTNDNPADLLGSWSAATNCADLSTSVTTNTFALSASVSAGTNWLVLSFTEQVLPWSGDAYVNVGYGDNQTWYDRQRGYNAADGLWHQAGVGGYPGWVVVRGSQ